MARAIFGEYGAYMTPGGIRFQKHNKLVSEKVLPPEVAAYLKKSLGVQQEVVEPPKQKFPRPTPEQIAKMKEESMQVPPELQRTPEEMAEATFYEDEIQLQPLTADDFDTEELKEPDTEYLKEPDEIVGAEIIDKGITGKSVDMVDPDFLESVSIHTASIEDIAEALYARFGIYTVWLKRQPVADEVNPLTGAPFTKYHLGIAYQAAIYAANKGLLDLDPATNRRAIDEGRAASQNFQDSFVPQAVTIRENREQNTYDYRTSPIGTREVPQTEIVHEKGADGQIHAVQRTINGEASETGLKNGAGVGYDQDEDEPLVQPNFTGKPVIRPNW